MEIDERAVKFHTLGNTLLGERKYNDAIANYKKAIEIAPDYASAWYHMAETYEAKNLDEEAEKAYFKAIELNPSFAEIHIQSGLDSLIHGPLGDAIIEYKRMKGVGGAPPAPEPALPPAGPAPGEGPPAPVAEVISDDAPIPEPPGAQAAPPAPAARPGGIELMPAEEMSSPAGAEDFIMAKLLSEDGKPVPGVTVDFKLRDDEDTKDAILFPPGTDDPAKGQKTVSAQTDGEGTATVKFRRASKVAENIVYVAATDMEDTRLCDRTVPAELVKVDIASDKMEFRVGDEATMTFKPFDRFDNVVPATEFDVGLAVNEGEWKKLDSFKIKTNSKGVAEKTLKLPERAGVPCRFEISEPGRKFNFKAEVAIVPAVPDRAFFHPDGAKVAAGRDFVAAVRIEDRFGNAVPDEFTSLMVTEQGEEKWEVGEPENSATNEDGAIFFPVTPPASPGEKAKMAVSSTNLRPGEGSAVTFETCSEAEAQEWSEVPPWAAAKEEPPAAEAPPVEEAEPAVDKAPSAPEVPAVEEEKPAAEVESPLAALELGVEEEPAALSEMPEEITIGKETAMVTGASGGEGGAQDAPERPAGGAGSAFDGIDFDGGDSVFGRSADAPEDAVKPGEADTAPVPPPAGAAAGGSTFDELGDMLSDEGGEGPAPAGIAPAGPPAEPPVAEVTQPEAAPEPVAEEPIAPAVPPPDEPAAEVEEKVAAEPAPDIPLPEDEGVSEAVPEESGPELNIVLEEESRAVPAGELSPVVVKILDSEGNRLDGKKVELAIREDETGGMDSVFIQPSGEPGGKEFESLSDMTGTVMVTFQASRVSGKAAVLVKCGERTNTMEIEITQAGPERVVLSPSEVEVGAGSPVEVCAKVMDGNGNPVKGVVCTFSLDESSDRDGELEIQLQSMTDGNGEVRVNYSTAKRPGAVAVITASCSGVEPDRIEPARITTRPGEAEPVAEQPAVEEPMELTAPGLEEPAPSPPPPEPPADYEMALPPAPEAPGEELTMEDLPLPPPPPQEETAPPPQPEQPMMQEPELPPPPDADLQAPSIPPPPPPPSPDIEVLDDGLAHQTAELEYQRQSESASPEEIAAGLEEAMPEVAAPEPEDPLAAPRFHVEKGKKAIIEVERVASKTVMFSAVAVIAVGILVAAYFGYKWTSTSYHFMQGMKAFNAEQFDSAIPHFDKCVRLSPGWTKPLEYLAQVHFEKAEVFKKQNNTSAYRKEITWSISKLDEIIRIDPNNVEAHFARAQAYEFKGEFERAMRDYRKVVAMDPSYSSAKMKIENLEEKIRTE